MDILIKAVQFFLCFTILIGIHEFGHFIVARIFKIRVEKFYIFFDPWFSLFKWKRGDTEYGVGWLPLGGYVKIAGMIDESMDKEQMAQPMQQDEFRAKPAWQRLLVMIAGVVMNILLAICIYIGISYTWGDSYFSNSEAKWGYNFNESAEALGFVDGDKLISIDGQEIDNIAEVIPTLLITDQDRVVRVERNGEQMDLTLPLNELVEMRQAGGHVGFFEPIIPFVIDSINSETAAAILQKGDRIVGLEQQRENDLNKYIEYFAEHKNESVTISVMRADSLVEVSLPINAEGKIGGVMTVVPFTLSTKEYTLLESIPAGFRKAGNMISSYWNQLKMMVNPETKLYKEVGGFIAIANIFDTQWNWMDFWLKTALLSVMLAIMNILPIPGLDGGHTLFTLWEIVTGRKPSDKFLEVVQTIGIVLLMGLLLYANGSDIIRLFK
ncbi:MAG: RIP metalloprotease RseP [Rikenellaceae bacterium]